MGWLVSTNVGAASYENICITATVVFVRVLVLVLIVLPLVLVPLLVPKVMLLLIF